MLQERTPTNYACVINHFASPTCAHPVISRSSVHLRMAIGQFCIHGKTFYQQPKDFAFKMLKNGHKIRGEGIEHEIEQLFMGLHTLAAAVSGKVAK